MSWSSKSATNQFLDPHFLTATKNYHLFVALYWLLNFKCPKTVPNFQIKFDSFKIRNLHFGTNFASNLTLERLYTAHVLSMCDVDLVHIENYFSAIGQPKKKVRIECEKIEMKLQFSPKFKWIGENCKMDKSFDQNSSKASTPQQVDRLKVLYPNVNEEITPLPRGWSQEMKCSSIHVNNFRVHYKGEQLSGPRCEPSIGARHQWPWQHFCHFYPIFSLSSRLLDNHCSAAMAAGAAKCVSKRISWFHTEKSKYWPGNLEGLGKVL